MKRSDYVRTEDYMSPACDVVSLCSEGILCASAKSMYEITIDGYTEDDETYW